MIACIWSGAKGVLTEAGFDVVWVGDFLKDPGDEAIMQLAFESNHVLVTLDKDFGELAIFRRLPHFGIVRITGYPANELGGVIKHIIEKYKKDLLGSAIITVDKQKVRIRTED